MQGIGLLVTIMMISVADNYDNVVSEGGQAGDQWVGLPSPDDPMEAHGEGWEEGAETYLGTYSWRPC